MDLDATGDKAGELRNHTWQEGDMSFIKCMRNAMIENCPQTWIGQRVEDVVARGVLLENNVDSIRPACSTTWCFTWRGNKNTRRKLWKLSKLSIGHHTLFVILCPL